MKLDKMVGGGNVKIGTLIIVLLSVSARADVLSVHCPLGCPSNPSDNDLVFAHVYALSNNPETKFADWVAYEVDVTNFGPSPVRNWTSDPLLVKEATLEREDYRRVRDELDADRGHQAPLASFAGSDYWYELNYLSNITPQDKDLNQGAWKDLEQAVRDALSYRDSLFVITGPLFEKRMKALPEADEPHKVPSGYFKIVYDRKGKAAVFKMNQDLLRSANYCDSRIALNDLAPLLDFQLPPLQQDLITARRLGCSP